jgi:hypothetical protein
MKNLSDRRKKIYRAFVDYMIANNGRPPSINDIMPKTDITSKSVYDSNLKQMIAMGYLDSLSSKPSVARSVGLVGAVYAVPRNVIEGNLYTITETSVFVDIGMPEATAVHDSLIDQGIHFSGWFQSAFDGGYALRILKPEQVAVVTNVPETILKAVAFGAAVYLPENVCRQVYAIEEIKACPCGSLFFHYDEDTGEWSCVDCGAIAND